MPEQPWHTQRDRLVEFASVLGLVAGSLGKFGRDVSLLMQTEAGEVFEPAGAGRGGSSTMPHKRNPVSSAVLIAAATRAPGPVSYTHLLEGFTHLIPTAAGHELIRQGRKDLTLIRMTPDLVYDCLLYTSRCV